MADLITYTLPGFPLVDQRHEPTVDGNPDENPDWNCVPASLSAGLRYLTGKPFDGDQLKDAVYGQGYRGAQAARAYIAYCARQGVTLAAYDSRDPAALVARIHAELRAGHPVVLTMPSQWGIPPVDPLHPTGSTHVGSACGYGPGALRIMNPWGGFWHDGTDAYWMARLCEGEIWIMSKIGATTMAWHVGSDGWATDDHGHRVGPGIVTGLQSAGWMGVDAVADETPYDAIGSMYVALANHHTVEWSKTGGSTVDQAGPALIAQRAEIDDLRRQLDEAKKQQSAPLTPKERAAIALGQALDAYEAAK